MPDYIGRTLNDRDCPIAIFNVLCEIASRLGTEPVRITIEGEHGRTKSYTAVPTYCLLIPRALLLYTRRRLHRVLLRVREPRPCVDHLAFRGVQLRELLVYFCCCRPHLGIRNDQICRHNHLGRKCTPWHVREGEALRVLVKCMHYRSHALNQFLNFVSSRNKCSTFRDVLACLF